MSHTSRKAGICTFLCSLSIVPIAGCQEDDNEPEPVAMDAAADANVDVAPLGQCEQLAAYMQISVVPGGPAISAASVAGCRAYVSPTVSCTMPARSLNVVSTEQQACTFTLMSTAGQVFTFSSEVKTLKLSTPYKCLSNGMFEVDFYRAFVPANVIVDFDKADAGTADVLPLFTNGGGADTGTAACQ